MKNKMKIAQQKIVWNIIAAKIFFLALFVFMQSPATVQAEGGEIIENDDRYVDCKNGSDANSGGWVQLPDGSWDIAAWQTLKKVSEKNFGPNARVRLKRGCVYKDALIIHGDGDFEGGRWITFEDYGDEHDVKPTIDRANATDENSAFSIKLEGNEAVRIHNINITNGRTGIVDLGRDTPTKGLSIEDVEIENINNEKVDEQYSLPIVSQKPEDDTRYYMSFRYPTAVQIGGRGWCEDGERPSIETCAGDIGNRVGIRGAKRSFIALENVKIKNAVAAVKIWPGDVEDAYLAYSETGSYERGYGKNIYINNLEIDGTDIGGMDFGFAENVLIKNVNMKNAGRKSFWAGTYLNDFNFTKLVAVVGGVMTGTSIAGETVRYDGEGTVNNLNGPNDDVYFIGLNIYNNGGPAFATQGNPQPDPTHFTVIGCNIHGNAKLNDDPHHGGDMYPQTAILWNPGVGPEARVTLATFFGNLIEMDGHKHLLTIAKQDSNGNYLYPIKDDLDFESDPRIDSPSFACDNYKRRKDGSAGSFIPGNRSCAEAPGGYPGAPGGGGRQEDPGQKILRSLREKLGVDIGINEIPGVPGQNPATIPIEETDKGIYITDPKETDLPHIFPIDEKKPVDDPVTILQIEEPVKQDEQVRVPVENKPEETQKGFYITDPKETEPHILPIEEPVMIQPVEEKPSVKEEEAPAITRNEERKDKRAAKKENSQPVKTLYQ